MSQAESPVSQPISPGHLYPTSILLRDLGISDNTLKQWRKSGLKFVDRSRLGTKSDYYWSDDVLSFIREHGTGKGANNA